MLDRLRLAFFEELEVAVEEVVLLQQLQPLTSLKKIQLQKQKQYLLKRMVISEFHLPQYNKLKLYPSLKKNQL